MGTFFYKCLVLLCISSTSWAVNPSPISTLNQILKGKTLKCKPSHQQKPTDSRTRGDEGYFSINVVKNQVLISDNGGDGYGFSNGEFRDLVFTEDTRMVLSVGDDGFQTLMLDFDRMGASSRQPENCGTGVLLDAPQSDYIASSTIELSCCLK